MSWETILPETAKALSAPITKLIEVVSAGCGNVYEPTNIRRKAKAEAEALLAFAEAREEVTDIQLRAVARRLQNETRRQENIESVIAHAALALGESEEVSSDPVNEDWATRFFADCADFSDDSVRLIWGKILAGEIQQPNSFSLRTLSTLRDLSKGDAELFNILCKYSFKIGDKQLSPIYTSDTKAFWESKGIDFSAYQRLISAGLVTHHPMGITVSNATSYLLEGSHVSFYYTNPQFSTFPLGFIVLTSAGQEISQVCEWDTTDRNLAMKSFRPNGFTGNAIKILQRLDNGQVGYEDVEI